MPATSLATLDTTTLALAPLGGKGNMRFSSLRGGDGRNVVFLVDAVCVLPPTTSEFGMSMVVAPSLPDIDRMLTLENWLAPPTDPVRQAQLGMQDFARYEHRGTLNANLQLNLKLKSVGDVWKFTCNGDETSFSPANAQVARGARLRLTLSPGFYFSNLDNRYGLFYTLQDLQFM